MHKTHYMIIHEAVTLGETQRRPRLSPVSGGAPSGPSTRLPSPFSLHPKTATLDLLLTCYLFVPCFKNPISHCLPVVTGPGREGSEYLGLSKRQKGGSGNGASRTDHTPTTCRDSELAPPLLLWLQPTPVSGTPTWAHIGV